MTGIGVLAGMGPRSTAPFIDLLVTACQEQLGCQQDDDFPPMHILSWPTPFRVYGEGSDYDDSMRAAIAAGFQRLLSTETCLDVICMPCNSAHAYVSAKGPNRPPGVDWVGIVEATLAYLPAGERDVVLWATPGTVRSGIYQAGLNQAFNSAVTEQQQPSVSALITSVKEGNIAAASASVCSLVAQLTQSPTSCEATPTVIVACTDINPALLAAGATKAGPCLLKLETVLLVDSAACLAAAVVSRVQM